jgi:hypothetical protein
MAPTILLSSLSFLFLVFAIMKSFAAWHRSIAHLLVASASFALALWAAWGAYIYAPGVCQ